MHLSRWFVLVCPDPSAISQMGQGSLCWWRLVSQFCVTFAGVVRTARMSLWATGGGRTMTTCTGSTCPAYTAAVAAMAARPPSRLLPTPSVMHRSQSTCKYGVRRWVFHLNSFLHSIKSVQMQLLLSSCNAHETWGTFCLLFSVKSNGGGESQTYKLWYAGVWPDIVFYINRAQNANFQNSRCENTPLIGRESPPPSVSLSYISNSFGCVIEPEPH